VDLDRLGDKDGMATLVQTTWGMRQPYPEGTEAIPINPADKPPEATLDAFLKAVEIERSTFAQRLRPDTTLCLDIDGAEYLWPEGDPAAIARRYAQDVVEKKTLAGEMVIRAATRFLNDLEDCHARGLYFDSAAARHIVQFAETYCGLQLMEWQVFALVNLFAWKKPVGTRRFTESWISCSKKNGKTRLASCVALWGLVCDREEYPDVFAAATKKEQSRLVWRDGRRCVADNPELRAHVQRWAGALAVKDTDGSFTPLSSDEKSMDGLRPSVIIADEIAFWSDREQWDKLVKGVVSRTQPLTFAVTTAGTTKQCFAYGKFALGEKILRGVINDDTTFVLIYAIDAGDDPMDEACWAKSNPSLSVTLQVEHLIKTRDEVREDPSGLSSFLQYHCNIWPEVNLSRAGSIPAARWDKCDGLDLIGEKDPRKAMAKFLQLNVDTPCFLGVDVGLTGDFSAIASVWPAARFRAGEAPLVKPTVIVQCYAPEVGILEKQKAFGVPLDVWVREGWLQLLPGDITDPRELQKEVREFCKLGMREVGFDPWQFSVAAAELNEEGISCVAVQQVPSQLTAPCREFAAAINRGELVHFGNPMLTWMAGNVVWAESEKHGGCRPEKLNPPYTKIDDISAIVNAYHRALANPIPTAPRLFFMYEDGSAKVNNPATGHLELMPWPKEKKQ